MQFLGFLVVIINCYWQSLDPVRKALITLRHKNICPSDPNRARQSTCHDSYRAKKPILLQSQENPCGRASVTRERSPFGIISTHFSYTSSLERLREKEPASAWRQNCLYNSEPHSLRMSASYDRALKQHRSRLVSSESFAMLGVIKSDIFCNLYKNASASDSDSRESSLSRLSTFESRNS